MLNIFGLLLLSLSVVSALPNVGSFPSPYSESTWLADTNQRRALNGKPSLFWDARLKNAAMDQCLYLAAQGRLEHNSLQRPKGYQTPSERAMTYGFRWSGIAENLASESGFNWNEAGVNQSWMNSEGHRKNLLGDYTAAGVARCSKGSSYYWVALYATPASF
jgi:uncharacterized protein YkwD